MLKPDPTRRFKKDFKKYDHNKTVKKELETVLCILLKEEKLPEKYLDHALTGSYMVSGNAMLNQMLYLSIGQMMNMSIWFVSALILSYFNICGRLRKRKIVCQAYCRP